VRVPEAQNEPAEVALAPDAVFRGRNLRDVVWCVTHVKKMHMLKNAYVKKMHMLVDA